MALDLANSDSRAAFVKEIFKTWESIDVLINNAGYGLVSPFEGATE